MLTKIKDLLNTVKNFLPGKSNKSPSMKEVIYLAYTYTILISLFVAGWIWNWYHNKVADLPIMLQLIVAVFAPASLAFFTFIGRSLVDLNKNGIPDSFEGNDDSDTTNLLGRRISKETINDVRQNVNQNQRTAGQGNQQMPVNPNRTEPIQRPNQSRDPELQE